MNRFEMGRVLAFLLQYRRMETIPRGKGLRDERELARTLDEADIETRTELDGLLLGFGFDIVTFSDFQTQGLAPGGKVFLLLRRLDQASALFSERWIDERMQLKNDTITSRRIWFTQLWFVLFSIFYSRRNRVATEVSRYVETTFTRTDLVQAMHDYINDLVRKMGQDTLQSDVVYSCLIAESGTIVDKYASRFIDLMVDGAQIDNLGADRYRQSLLCALEMKSNYLQGLEPWIQATGPLETGRDLLVRPSDSSEY
ncbi:hypothetical protein K4H28_14520 [Deefgea tanakiae]|uniref:Uncharacterized protein n=1 Tax=Deefgea tanakiae TaxID=2865840 RepID=A0ABX8Z4I3_9NEIS|nr:hypothetical protein [Deefgea tanakiae]QZA77478.1 hypothetical protein K4H28_14520 [Deefgea tanakiae]